VRSGNVELPLMHWGSHQRRPHSAEYCFGDEAMNRYKDEGVCKIVYIDLPRHPRIEELRARLSALNGLDVTSSWENNLELMPAGVGKGPAVSELAQRLGIKREQVMCLGDYDNDLSMIEYAGVGVAMENGSDRVKRAAAWIAPSNQECGVAQAIRRFAL
ncbi:MAG: HAD-IIB family hydrolase, partial [Eubacteriales bacterium]|nr:HAD-IIB family hydrolase [Eubacteriales bacterium]